MKRGQPYHYAKRFDICPNCGKREPLKPCGLCAVCSRQADDRRKAENRKASFGKCPYCNQGIWKEAGFQRHAEQCAAYLELDKKRTEIVRLKDGD